MNDQHCRLDYLHKLLEHALRTAPTEAIIASVSWPGNDFNAARFCDYDVQTFTSHLEHALYLATQPVNRSFRILTSRPHPNPAHLLRFHDRPVRLTMSLPRSARPRRLFLRKPLPTN